MERSRSSRSPVLRRAYRGESMLGTFRDGDCLWVAPVPFPEVRVGDVVAYTAGGRVVAHRVVSVARSSLFTRGDSAAEPDPAPVAPDQLLGKVVMREHRGKQQPVAGGATGRGRGWWLRGMGRLRRWFLFPLAPVYRALRASRWVARAWNPGVVAVRYEGAEGGRVKYIHRGQTVACWFPRTQRWECRKPYDLVLEPPTR